MLVYKAAILASGTPVIVTMEIPPEARTNLGFANDEEAPYITDRAWVERITDENGCPYLCVESSFLPKGETRLLYILWNLVTSEYNENPARKQGIHFFLNPESARQFANQTSNRLRTTFHSKGCLATECEYRNGKKEGMCRKWYTTGEPYSEETFHNGVANGVLTIWHKNGIPWRRGTVRNGIEDLTTFKLWTKDGTQRSHPLVSICPPKM